MVRLDCWQAPASQSPKTLLASVSRQSVSPACSAKLLSAVRASSMHSGMIIGFASDLQDTAQYAFLAITSSRVADASGVRGRTSVATATPCVNRYWNTRGGLVEAKYTLYW